jgi:hypothetical protein
MLKTCSTIENIFDEQFNGEKNFITPGIVEYSSINEILIYELSFGYGLEHNKIWGLTVLETNQFNNSRRRFDLDKCFQSIKEARDFIKELKKEVKKDKFLRKREEKFYKND